MSTIRKKMVVVGDGNCGKTCFLMVYKEEDFRETYVPTVFESYVITVNVDGRKVEFTMVDTAGQEEYDRLRPLTYPGTDVVIAMFSIADPDSLDNIVHRWLPEIKHYLPHAPIVLVGNKKDLRQNLKTIQELRMRKSEPVSYAEGTQTAFRIKSYGYLECSAKENQGIKEVVLLATRASLEVKVKTNCRPRCVML